VQVDRRRAILVLFVISGIRRDGLPLEFSAGLKSRDCIPQGVVIRPSGTCPLMSAKLAIQGVALGCMEMYLKPLEYGLKHGKARQPSECHEVNYHGLTEPKAWM
jgi:hypothetical protein